MVLYPLELGSIRLQLQYYVEYSPFLTVLYQFFSEFSILLEWLGFNGVALSFCQLEVYHCLGSILSDLGTEDLQGIVLFSVFYFQSPLSQ